MTVPAVCLMPGAWAQTAPPATYYVAPTGSDTNAGTSTTAPFATIGKALSLSTGGQTIAVLSGTYNSFTDQKTRTQSVTVLGYGATPPVVTGTGNSDGYAANLNGAQGLTFNNFKFTGTIRIDSPLNGTQTAATRPSQNLTIRNCEITPTGVGVYIVRGAQNVTIDNNWIHGTSYGVFNNNQPVACSGITITNNLIEDIETDGIQAANWSNAVISNNVIRRLYVTSGDLHNDCIQLTGDIQHVSITNNILCHSGTQNMLIKPDFGPIDDILIQNNLMFDAEAVSVQVSNTTGCRFINNTVWNKGFGLDGMYLRGATTTDAIVANNCFSTFHKMDGAVATFEDYNFAIQTGLSGAHDIRNSTAGWENTHFVNAAAGDYHPSPTSQLLGKGTATYAPATDLDGASRSGTLPTIGAYEAGFKPSSAGLALWLKADAGVTNNTSGAVSAWQDQSGNGRNATQVTASQQPALELNAVNGKPALSFSGDFLTYSSINSQQYQVIVVAKPSLGLTARGSIVAGTTNSFQYAIDTDYKQIARKSTSTALGASTNAVSTSAFSRLSVRYGNPDLGFSLNGAPDGNASSATTFSSWLTLLGARAGTDYYKGYIAEILVYTTPLNRGSEARIQDYLAAKYGV